MDLPVPMLIKIRQSRDGADRDIVSLALRTLVLVALRMGADGEDDVPAVATIKRNFAAIHDEFFTLLTEGGDIHEVAIGRVGHREDR